MSEAIPAGFIASSFALVARPALCGKMPINRNGVTLDAVSGGYVVHVLAKATNRESDVLRDVVGRALFALRTVSPGQWFIVDDTALSHADFQALAARLKPAGDVVDQSHGRVRIRLRGPQAARVLSKGTAIDLVLSSFPVGRSATTLIGHIGAHITRINNDGFEIIVLRGFAESLWDELDHMSREFISGETVSSNGQDY
jgi:sarcosine oxidase subunit gamma